MIRRTSTAGLHCSILALVLATTTIVATLTASLQFGATQRTLNSAGTSAITATTVTLGTTAPFHRLAAAQSIAMGMSLETWTKRMAVTANALMGGLAATARSHRYAQLPKTATVTALPMIRIPPMVALALAQMVSVVALAQHRRSAMLQSTALHMEQQRTMMQVTAACATVLMTIVVT